MGLDWRSWCYKAVCHSALAVVAVALLPQLAQGQQAEPGKNDAVFMYRGADRDPRLLQKAREEGRLVWYTSMAQTESVPLTKAFEAKYGVKVELWRASSDKVRQRMLTEAQGKRFTADVVEMTGAEMESLARERLLSPFHSPYLADLPPALVPQHREWVPSRLNILVVAFNTNKVKREDLPATYEGFLDPKWKGMMALESGDFDWMATMIEVMGRERGMAFFRRLGEMRPELRKGHTLLAELITAGEVPVGLTVYNSNVESMKRRGGPIDWAPVQPVVANPQAMALTKHAPHPHAALLFMDFMLSPEGQELLNSMGRIPSSLKVHSKLKNFPITNVKPAIVLDESAKWLTLWDDLFVKK
jgi:iron(III) transport system substrate-binding protein